MEFVWTSAEMDTSLTSSQQPSVMTGILSVEMGAPRTVQLRRDTYAVLLLPRNALLRFR